MASRPVYVPRYTLADYQQWPGDWQMIDGVAIAMTPSPFGPHERVVSRLSRTIGNQLEQCGVGCEVYTNLDWIISDDTVVRPDLMVVCGAQPERHLQQRPAMVVEVLSEATRGQNLMVKRALYREQNVPHYLIIDTEARTIEHVTAAGGRSLKAADTLELALDDNPACLVSIACGKLFDSAR
jgi:Uncharacterized protein conserved in cyanobacteria